MVVAKYPTTTLFFLLCSCCFFMLFFAGSLSPLSTFRFSPNGLSLNFCQDFLGFLCIFFQKDDIPLKTQQPTPWNLCCLMRGIQCFSHNEGDLVCSLNEMGFSTLPIRKLSSICCFIFGFCLYFFISVGRRDYEHSFNSPKHPLGFIWG